MFDILGLNSNGWVKGEGRVMDDKKTELEKNGAADLVSESPDKIGLVRSRRRLFRKGASVIAVTLVSRPVLAWHCKSPSAWGSELINPNTSLKTNDGHSSYADETWTISNWVANQSRNNFGKPWAKLKSKFPALKDSSTTSTDNQGRTYFDFTKVTVKKLFTSVSGLARPSGLTDNAKITEVLNLGSDLQKYTIVAQLNYILLAPLGAPNDLDRCLTLQDLQRMASGSYSPSNMGSVTWGPMEIKDYLFNNWIVRP